MSVEEFAQGPAQSGILTDRCSSSSIFLCFHCCPAKPCFHVSNIVQGNSLPVLAFHSEPQTTGGVSRRSALLHDREGADSVQVQKA